MSSAETDKLLPFPFPKPPKSKSIPPFEENLALRLRSLLPIPSSPPSTPLSWLARAVDLLAGTLADFAALIAGKSLSAADRTAVAGFLDSGAGLLDALNDTTAEIERLSRRRLEIRFALRLLSNNSDNARRRKARDLVSRPDRTRKPEIRRLNPVDPLPRGKISVVRRAIYAVGVVSELVITATSAALCGGGEDRHRVVVSGDFVWAEAFREVEAAVSCRRFGAGEVEAVEEAAGRLAAVIDDGEKTERLTKAVDEVERALEELTVGADRLGSAVSGLFRVALCTRNTALQGFRNCLVD